MGKAATTTPAQLLSTHAPLVMFIPMTAFKPNAVSFNQFAGGSNNRAGDNELMSPDNLRSDAHIMWATFTQVFFQVAHICTHDQERGASLYWEAVESDTKGTIAGYRFWLLSTSSESTFAETMRSVVEFYRVQKALAETGTDAKAKSFMARFKNNSLQPFEQWKVIPLQMNWLAVVTYCLGVDFSNDPEFGHDMTKPFHARCSFAMQGHHFEGRAVHIDLSPDQGCDGDSAHYVRVSADSSAQYAVVWPRPSMVYSVPKDMVTPQLLYRMMFPHVQKNDDLLTRALQNVQLVISATQPQPQETRAVATEPQESQAAATEPQQKRARLDFLATIPGNRQGGGRETWALRDAYGLRVQSQNLYGPETETVAPEGEDYSAYADTRAMVDRYLRTLQEGDKPRDEAALFDATLLSDRDDLAHGVFSPPATRCAYELVTDAAFRNFENLMAHSTKHSPAELAIDRYAAQQKFLDVHERGMWTNDLSNSARAGISIAQYHVISCLNHLEQVFDVNHTHGLTFHIYQVALDAWRFGFNLVRHFTPFFLSALTDAMTAL
jgi:hypothetical protein